MNRKREKGKRKKAPRRKPSARQAAKELIATEDRAAAAKVKKHVGPRGHATKASG